VTDEPAVVPSEVEPSTGASSPVPAEASEAPASEPGQADDAKAADVAPTDPLSRRTFVLRSMAAIGGVTGALLVIPVVGYAAAPGLKAGTPVRFLSTSVAPTLRSDTWSRVGAVTDFEVGVPKYVLVDRHIVDGWVQETTPVGVHVVRQSDTEAVVYDPHCTHLGCPLAWSDGAGAFVCPCHGGSFGPDGNVRSGPPPRPMVRYETKIENGDLFIGALPVGA